MPPSSSVIAEPFALPRPLADLGEVLAARRRPLPNEVFSEYDCLCVSPFPGTNGQLYVSSPNMDFVPRVPIHDPLIPIRLHLDGMAGIHEAYKWPQAHFDQEPHACSVPANPAICMFGCSNAGDFRSFPLGDENNDLPSFEDDAIAWCGFNNFKFWVSVDLPGELVGSLCASKLGRMEKASLEILEMVRTFQIPAFLTPNVPQTVMDALVKQFRHIKWRTQCLHRVYDRLKNIPMSSFDTAMWFREFQRILLDLRGMVIYRKVVWPRLLDEDFHKPSPVLPLRGVITFNPDVLHQMYRVGVPVWYIHKSYTLTDRTCIVRVWEFISGGIAFSSLTTMNHDGHVAEAPLLVDAMIDEAGHDDLATRLAKVSILSRLLLRPLKPYSAADAGACSSGRRYGIQCEIAGPDNTAERPSVPTTIDIVDPQQAKRQVRCAERLYGTSYVDISDVDTVQPSRPMYEAEATHEVAPVHDEVESAQTEVRGYESPGAEQTVPVQKLEDVRQKPKTSRQLEAEARMTEEKAAKHRRIEANIAADMSHRSKPPAWLPPYSPGWETALEESPPVVEVPCTSFVFVLPPISIFYADASNFFAENLHNWLHIRTWCLLQIYDPPDDRLVLMMKSQWAIALQGGYHYVKYKDSHFRPLSPVADIERLPPRPSVNTSGFMNSGDSSKNETSVELETGEIKDSSPSHRHRNGEKKNSRCQRQADSRLIDRVDINVCFGVYAGFPPYVRDTIVRWNDMDVTYEMIASSKDIAAMVVSELSILNFCLDLLDLDRQMLPNLYIDPNSAMEREDAIFEIWGGGGFQTIVDISSGCERTKAVMLFGEIMQIWSGGDSLKCLDTFADPTKWDSFLAFEKRVYAFFISRFAQTFHRDGNFVCLAAYLPMAMMLDDSAASLTRLSIMVDTLGAHEDEPEECLSVQETREQRVYMELLALVPFLEQRLMTDCDENEMMRIADLIQRGAANARADDTKSLKDPILDWIGTPGEAFEPPLSRNSKVSRGYQHDVTGALLCPAGLDWENPTTKKQLKSGEMAVPGDQWPIFLYAGKYNPEEPWDGLLRSKLLVKAYRYIFTSPSSVDDETKATRAGNARIHGMTKVTPASIAYIATQVRFALSSSQVFSRTDTATDSERFYNSILNVLTDVEEIEQINDLLAWWNRYFRLCDRSSGTGKEQCAR
ncbi:hypothetical protein A0H81_09007 [Grifola frondosa]|uniref:Uncharacterized protein n=1 Tax=Grifola frondosa TaxID=5627 RepID=A0A1C7M211_GRIFR|nr:hypothetical protein A0H81_09007 [Grifola frondosa]